jgi:hypothetical protein
MVSADFVPTFASQIGCLFQLRWLQWIWCQLLLYCMLAPLCSVVFSLTGTISLHGAQPFYVNSGSVELASVNFLCQTFLCKVLCLSVELASAFLQ